jgi:DNA polymerase-3 subunit delta'
MSTATESALKAVDLPWLQDAWRRLGENRERLPHAILLSGVRGLGKNALAHDLARTWLCLQPKGGRACGECRSCQLLAAGNHPDLAVVRPLEEGKSISIDQIRELRHFLSLTPHTAPRKVVLLSPAEAMTLAAANALLKQLEEPPPGNILLLVSAQIDRLPVTIRSRCTRVDIAAPAPESAQAWLEQRGMSARDAEQLLPNAGYAPLRAQFLYNEGFLEQRRQWMADVASLARADGDPLACAGRWTAQGAETSLTWFYGLLRDVLCYRVQGPSSSALANGDLEAQLGAALERVPLQAVAELASTVVEALRLLGSGLDQRLLIEDILIRWNKSNLSRK